jgi:hypothetical protein
MDLAVQTGRFVCDQGTVVNASIGIIQKLLTIVANGLSVPVTAHAVDPDHHLESLLLSQDPCKLLVSRHVDSLHR